MSGMAAEIAARMAADNQDPVGDQPAGGVPGNEGGGVPPAAEPSNTDTGTQGGTPESIPYARFKEVNDQLVELKDFKILKDYGYDPDSLGRLAAFEASYQQDPIGTMKSMAASLDLPQEVLDALENASKGDETTPPEPAGATAGGDAPTPPPLSAEDRERLEYVDQLRAREVEQANDAKLNAVLAAWSELDKNDNIATPSERFMLTQITGVLSTGATFQRPEDLAKAARDLVLEYRDGVLGGAVRRTGPGGAPLPNALPGSLPAAGSEPVHFTDLRQASKAAQAAIESGNLPSI